MAYLQRETHYCKYHGWQRTLALIIATNYSSEPFNASRKFMIFYLWQHTKKQVSWKMYEVAPCYYAEKWLWWCCYGETNSSYLNESISLYFIACRYHVHKSQRDILLASSSQYFNANMFQVHKCLLDISWQVVHCTSIRVVMMHVRLSRCNRCI
jgi:hypothetical protein